MNSFAVFIKFVKTCIGGETDFGIRRNKTGSIFSVRIICSKLILSYQIETFLQVKSETFKYKISLGRF